MNTKTITRTALLLALAVAGQFFKNLSVYITGPVINCILIIAALYCGTVSGVFLSAVLPVTSWLITGSPIMTAMPVIVPCVMAGNLILALLARLAVSRGGSDGRLSLCLTAGCAAKALFMGLTISLLVLQLQGPGSGLPEKALTAAKITFSLTQLTTGLIGAALAFSLKKALDRTAGVRVAEGRSLTGD